METVDYPTRAGMIEALMAARADGVAVEVVGNGRTLRFPAGYGASDAPETPGGPQLAAVPTPEGSEGAESPSEVVKGTVDEVNAYLDEHPDQAEAVLALEAEDSSRKGILEGPHSPDDEDLL